MTTILIVEDDIEMLDNLSEMINFYGFEVIKSSRGKEAVDLANNKKPDLMLCDMNLKDMSGLEVYKSIQKNSLTSKIPFILITGETDQMAKKIAIEVGVDDFILKPFDEDVLIATIKNKISKSKNTQSRINNIIAESNTNLQELLFTVAHKLRSPIETSKGLINLLEDTERYKINKEEFNKIYTNLKANINEIDKLSAELSVFLNKIQEKKH